MIDVFAQKIENGEWKDKKWDDLTHEDKVLWEGFASKNERKLALWKALCESKKCYLCSKKMSLVIPNSGEANKSFWEMLSPEWLFHIKTTHGGYPIFVALAKRFGAEIPDFLIK